MEKQGNTKASEVWEARFPPHFQKPNEFASKEYYSKAPLHRESLDLMIPQPSRILKKWIEDKYIYKKYKKEEIQEMREVIDVIGSKDIENLPFSW